MALDFEKPMEAPRTFREDLVPFPAATWGRLRLGSAQGASHRQVQDPQTAQVAAAGVLLFAPAAPDRAAGDAGKAPGKARGKPRRASSYKKREKDGGRRPMSLGQGKNHFKGTFVGAHEFGGISV